MVRKTTNWKLLRMDFVLFVLQKMSYLWMLVLGLNGLSSNSCFMRKKMEKEMANSAQIDTAFKDIKTATGVTDVQELVKKFLTREQTYSDLLQNVNDSDKKVDVLKKDNEMLRNRLHDLKIDSEANAAAAQEGDAQF